MNKILEVRPGDFVARVQPGVTRMTLNAELEESGLFFSPDPGWDASLGGMAATNAGGSNALRYGVMRDQVLGLEVALADGTVMHTGGFALKTSAGYDLPNLFVGSEGTLGIITELTLRLRPMPEKLVAASAVFPSVEKAVQATVAIIRSGTQVNRVELVDRRTVEAVNLYKGTDYPEAPSLFFEFGGSESAVADDVDRARKISTAHGCEYFDSEANEMARKRLWEARHEAALAIGELNPGTRQLSTDVCVPISDLPESLATARRVLDSHSVDGVVLGHVGDGNYHAVFPVDLNNEASVETARKVSAEIVDHALARGGTCSGEHGVGLGKIGYLEREHGDAVAFMRQIKSLSDPKNILNPGKIFAE